MSAELLEQRVGQLEARLQALEELVERKRRWPFGISLEEAKTLMENPPVLTPEDVERAKSIVGIWEGPEDASSHLRDYLRRDKNKVEE
jgi:hypothetical protein